MWITPLNVANVYPDCDPSEAFIEHVQGLAEAVIGVQEEPVSARLKAVMVEIVYRLSRAAVQNPDGVVQESIGGYSYTVGSQSGLGLSDAEKRNLRLAAGVGDLSVVSTTRGTVEMADRWDDERHWADQ